MFTDIVEDMHKEIAKSIIERIDKLKLPREKVLNCPKRVTEIRKYAELDGDSENYKKFKLKYYESHPNFLGKIEEYNYLYDLYKYDDRDTFEKKSLLVCGTDNSRKEKQNYDKMLWGHIDWDNMLNCIISELSLLDTTTELGELFENSLNRNLYRSWIKREGENIIYGKIYHEEKEVVEIRKHAIEWVFLRHGSEEFKTFFLNELKGETLREFDVKFKMVIHKFLLKKQPKPDFTNSLQFFIRENSERFGNISQLCSKKTGDIINISQNIDYFNDIVAYERLKEK